MDATLEETIVRISDQPLPHGRRFLWYLDLNLLALSPCVCPEEQETVISEAQEEWRRHHIRLMPA